MRQSTVRVSGVGKGRKKALRSRGLQRRVEDLDARVELIQALIPLGLEAVNDLLQGEVTQLAGERYRREGGRRGHDRWGSQKGSVYLSDQKLSIRVPRVRNVITDAEVPLSTYGRLQEPRRADEIAMGKVLKGLSCREYESCVEPVAETFGLSGSSLSRRFKRASARKLQELNERDLSKYDIVGMFLDGKTFGEDEIVIALGVTMKGDKVILGFVSRRAGRHRERGRMLPVSARPEGTRPGCIARRAVRDRRREGTAQGGGQGVCR